MTTTVNGTKAEAPAVGFKSINIAAGLLMAQRFIKELPKGSQNSYHDYAYTSADTRIKFAREALHQAGMMFALVKHDVYARKDISAVFDHDDESAFIFVKCHFRLEHECGEVRNYEFELPAIPGGGRPLDKAILGCMTTATGYVLRDLLQMPSEGGDENDVSGRDDRAVQAPRRAPAQNWQQKKAEQTMAAPTAPNQSSVKARLWGVIAAWAKVDPTDGAKLGDVGRRIFRSQKVAIEPGKASTEDLQKVVLFVLEQQKKKVVHEAWAAERDEKEEAEKALARGAPTPISEPDVIREEDIPF